MKLIVLSLMTIFISLGLFAQSVNFKEAAEVGNKFYLQKSSEFNLEKSQSRIKNQKLLRTESGNEAFYVLNYEDGGFVIVSADKRIAPVLAYSFENAFSANDIAPATQDWINMYMEQLDLIIENNISSDMRLDLMWEEALGESTILNKSIKGVDKLLETQWNQNYPYNYYCPLHSQGPGGRVYAGCVATAMAQVMNFWNYPETGRGEIAFFWGQYDNVNFGETEYKWDEMTETINDVSLNAIAELIYHCGVSVDMNYGYDGSGASITKSYFALKQNFKYKPGLKEVTKYRYDDSDWKFLLREDLDKGHPILYRGTDAGSNGHAFVCDGYQDTSYFHFNWGWGGAADGFYYLDNINPQMSFHYSQGALINITSYDAAYCNSLVYNQTDWTFDDGSGPNYYFNNQDCEWLISLTDHDVEFIKFNFTKFNTLEGDVLYVYEGNSDAGTLIGEYSLNDIPTELIVYSNEVYFKFVTNSDGQADGWEVMYSTSVLGVEDEVFSDLTIYPNPANDILNIVGLTDDSEIEIYDLSGKVQKVVNAQNRVSIDISDLAAGVYFVKVNSSENSVVKKMIKQ